jgi:hypothetical protein
MNKLLDDCQWYHGKLTNNDFNKLFKKHGDFLVRKSLHQSNQYTLSVYFNNRLHHFRINQLLNEYLFDNESIRFKSIKELIEHYLNNSIEITKSSGCLIKTPILRSSSTISSNKTSIMITNDNESYYELFTPSPLNTQTAMNPPPKPVRMPTIKSKEKPEVNLNTALL